MHSATRQSKRIAATARSWRQRRTRGQSRLGGLSGERAGDFQPSQTAISLTATSRSNWTMGARATIIEAKWPTGEIVRQIL